jgi:hypothetical protein
LTNRLRKEWRAHALCPLIQVFNRGRAGCYPDPSPRVEKTKAS